MNLCRSLLLIGVLVLPGPAPAQQRAVVVPANAAVAIPARGTEVPALAAPARRTRRTYSERLPVQPAGPDMSPLMVAVPLTVMAAVLAATLSGGSGGNGGISAPTRTR